MCQSCFSNLLLEPSLFSSSRPLGELPTTRRRFIASAVAGVAGSAALASSGAALAESPGADVIFRNGPIIPMTARPHGTRTSHKAADALAIANGRIVAMGPESEVLHLRVAGTRIVDLDGRTLMPGFVDPHLHTALSSLFAEFFEDVGYGNCRTHGDFLNALRALAARTPPGQWVRAYNYDNLLQGGDLSMAELDSISTQHPIIVWYTNGHDAAANTPAFAAAHISADVGPQPGGGHFGRGPDGKLNGMIYEESALFRFIGPALPKITPDVLRKAVADFTKKVAAVGNTTIHEPGTLRPEWIEGFAKLSNDLPCRLSASLMYDSLKALEAWRGLGVGARATQIPNSRFSLYGVKIVGDGSNQTRTGAQTVAYLNTQDKGALNFSADLIRKMVADVKAAGWPVLIHANGDATIDAALDAIEAAYGAHPATGVNRIEHSTMARPDQLARMKKLGVEPSFLMNHVFFYGAAYRDDLFGAKRAAFMDPAGACMRSGIPFTLHTDAPCSPPGPLRLIQTAVTRHCPVDNSVIGRDQAITVDAALRATTIDAARQIGLGDRIGSLEPGKEADLVILESDPRKVDPSKIMSIKVSETWVAGMKKYG